MPRPIRALSRTSPTKISPALPPDRRQELHRLHGRHVQDERQLAAVREEVERLARLLLEAAEPAGPPAQQAA